MSKLILETYRDRHGIPFGCIEVRQHMYPYTGPLMVRIQLDGYEVDFPHNEDYEVPPPSQWVRL